MYNLSHVQVTTKFQCSNGHIHYPTYKNKIHWAHTEKKREETYEYIHMYKQVYKCVCHAPVAMNVKPHKSVIFPCFPRQLGKIQLPDSINKSKPV